MNNLIYFINHVYDLKVKIILYGHPMTITMLNSMILFDIIMIYEYGLLLLVNQQYQMYIILMHLNFHQLNFHLNTIFFYYLIYYVINMGFYYHMIKILFYLNYYHLLLLNLVLNLLQNNLILDMRLMDILEYLFLMIPKFQIKLLDIVYFFLL